MSKAKMPPKKPANVNYVAGKLLNICGEAEEKIAQLSDFIPALEELTGAGKMPPTAYSAVRDKAADLRDALHIFLGSWGLQTDPRKEPVIQVRPLPPMPSRSIRVNDVVWTYTPTQDCNGISHAGWEGRRTKQAEGLKLAVEVGHLWRQPKDVFLTVRNGGNHRIATVASMIEAFLGEPFVPADGWYRWKPQKGRELEAWAAVATMFPDRPLPKKWAHARQP
jgi:hypothetical protein